MIGSVNLSKKTFLSCPVKSVSFEPWAILNFGITVLIKARKESAKLSLASAAGNKF